MLVMANIFIVATLHSCFVQEIFIRFLQWEQLDPQFR